MDFLQALKAHKGGLILIKSKLFWYGGHGWDNSPGRICLVLDASAAAAAQARRATSAATAASKSPAARTDELARAAALLLIGGAPHWVWVAQADVELIA